MTIVISDNDVLASYVEAISTATRNRVVLETVTIPVHVKPHRISSDRGEGYRVVAKNVIGPIASQSVINVKCRNPRKCIVVDDVVTRTTIARDPGRKCEMVNVDITSTGESNTTVDLDCIAGIDRKGNRLPRAAAGGLRPTTIAP